MPRKISEYLRNIDIVRIYKLYKIGIPQKEELVKYIKYMETKFFNLKRVEFKESPHHIFYFRGSKYILLYDKVNKSVRPAEYGFVYKSSVDFANNICSVHYDVEVDFSIDCVCVPNSDIIKKLYKKHYKI